MINNHLIHNMEKSFPNALKKEEQVKLNKL